MKRALITGICGQDGSYLAELLLAKEYEVYGLVRRSSHINYANISHIKDRLFLIEGELLDLSSLVYAVLEARPDEVYHLAASSHVGQSFQQPISTMEINALGTIRLLEAIRLANASRTRFYNASTSELFGQRCMYPQSETTPLNPCSPYGCSKMLAHMYVRYYREAYGIFAVNGILFNHESPRRGLDFVTRKITHGLARIALGLADYIELGDLYARRDWGYAGDYVRAMWLMLQNNVPTDYVIGSGESHSVMEFFYEACEAAGVEFDTDLIRTNGKFIRQADIPLLCANSSKAREELGWRPEIRFDVLVKMMVEHDLCLLKKDHPEK